MWVVRELYRPALERVLEWRYASLAAGIAVLLVSVAVVASGRMKFSFFPPVDGDFVSARLTMPQGAPVGLTEEAVLIERGHVGRHESLAELAGRPFVGLARDQSGQARLRCARHSP